MRQRNVTIALTVPILLAAGGCQITHVYTDVSEDPGYSPGGIVGRCFFLREGAYLLAHWTAVERFLAPLDKAVLATQRATTTQSVH
jgi:hypothetical protein